MTIEFITVKEMELFDKNDSTVNVINEQGVSSPVPLQGRSLGYRYKGIVNEAKPEQLFCIVGKDYTIVQHQTVHDIVKKVLEEQGLVHEENTYVMNEGGRLHMALNFPEIKYNVGGAGDVVKMMASFDNSFDGTTALNLNVAALVIDSLGKQGEYPVYGRIDVRKYARKHTKMIDPKEVGRMLERGVNDFRNALKTQFEDMINTPVSQDDAEALMQTLSPTEEEDLGNEKEKFKKIPQKYLRSIREALQSQRGITNIWTLYCLASKVFHQEVANIDSAKRFCIIFNTLLKEQFGN